MSDTRVFCALHVAATKNAIIINLIFMFNN